MPDLSMTGVMHLSATAMRKLMQDLSLGESSGGGVEGNLLVLAKTCGGRLSGCASCGCSIGGDLKQTQL